jgi:hypothetical protein
MANANSIYANNAIKSTVPIGFGETEYAIGTHAYPIYLNETNKRKRNISHLPLAQNYEILALINTETFQTLSPKAPIKKF